MEKKVSRFAEKNSMISPGDKIVLGLSGGADSVCLFFVLLSMRDCMGLKLICVHVNHGIRGREAMEDQEFCESLCREHGISVMVFTGNVREMAREGRISEEEAGRKYRYQCFRQVMEEKEYDKIAVAHHMGDQAETIVYHLCRGSGLKGLSGMSPVSGRIIRPFLCVSKAEITAYLTEREIGWREDGTNETLNYTRNRIRHRVMPCLEEINSQAAAHIAACGQYLKEADTYIRKKSMEAWERIAVPDKERIYFPLDSFSAEDIVIKKQLLQMGIERLAHGLRDISARHMEGVLQLAEGRPGKRINLPGGLLAARDYEGIYLAEIKESREAYGEIRITVKEEASYPLPNGTGSLWVSGPVDAGKIPPEEIEKNRENTYTKWFDYDTIKDTLRLRTRREGDYLMLPEGMGRKKLKSYFIDCKVPKEERDNIWLLADGSHILWIIGYRISDGCKIKADTGKAVKVTVSGEITVKNFR